MNDETATPPLTPATCDLRDFPRLMIDITRLFGSSFNAAASRTPLAWMVGHKLWYRSWHQVPAASLPDDDDELCHLAELGFDLKTFRKIKAVAMRGWIKCSDGRLYHPVVAEAALEAWLEKLRQRISSGSGNAKRWKTEFDPAPIEREIAATVELLQEINPQSRGIARAQRRSSQRAPDAVPTGCENDPGGMPAGVPMPSRSNRKGQGQGEGESIKKDLVAAEAAPPQTQSSGSRLAEDWTLPDGWAAWAASDLGWSAADALAEADVFRDFWRGKPGKDGRKADWEATWRNWCRRSSRSPTAATADARRAASRATAERYRAMGHGGSA